MTKKVLYSWYLGVTGALLLEVVLFYFFTQYFS